MIPAAFVAGWPVTHSRSPLIHKFWLERYGLAGDYRKEAIEPERAAQFFSGFDESGYVGGNVTVPHKRVAYSACDRLTRTAQRLGAVNTLWREGGLVWGDNTDGDGFAANLDQQAPSWDGGTTALVIGAGGAARAVIGALLDRGFRTVSAVNRTESKAHEIASVLGSRVTSAGLEALPVLLPGADLIVNATSSGLHGSAPVEVDWRRANPRAIATDLTYVPLVTPFLADAAAAGLTTVDGLGMLLQQAVPGFERWFGVRPIVDASLREHILADLAAQHC